jgi:hypothetical protein
MLDLSLWNLVDSHSDKLPARTDHSFTWEHNAAVASLDGDEGAHVRMDVRVQGDEPSNYRVYIHLPEDWLRRHTQDTLSTTAHSNAKFAFIGAFAMAVLVIFLRNLKHPAATAVPWRRISYGALLALAAFVCWLSTRIPVFVADYRTEYSSFVNYGSIGVAFLLGAAVFYGLVFILLGLGWFFLARSFGVNALLKGTAQPKAYYRDALVAGVSGVAIVATLPGLYQGLERLWPVPHYGFSASVPNLLDAAPPALQALASAVMFSVVAIGLLAMAAGFAHSYLRDAWKQMLMLGLIALLATPRWGSTAELLQSFVAAWAALLLIWWVARRFFRFNLQAYFLTVALLTLTGAAAELLGQPNTYFRANGGVLLIGALALLLWTWRAWRRADTRTGSEDSPCPSDAAARQGE